MAKSARVIFVSNPFEPLKDTRTYAVAPDRYTIRKWLKMKFRATDFGGKPTICLYNGKPILRRCWGRKIRAGDTITFVQQAQGPVAILLAVVAVVTVAAVVITLNNLKVSAPNIADTPNADPVYTFKGQNNQNRLGGPIECAYGRNKHYPSYSTQRYTQYIDGEQWLYQLFSMGHGQFDIEEVGIGDTAAEDLQDVEYEIIPPGSPVTLFPQNVNTSPSVDGIELLGTNESGLDGTQVEDSEGDAGVSIDPTDHLAKIVAGPYVANDSGTQTDRIEVDFQLPRGLYTQQDNGTLATATVTATIEARLIDDAGDPLGSWEEIIAFSRVLATNKPQRYTLSADVDLGRYEVRCQRTNARSASTRVQDQLIWEQLRAFIPDASTDPSITRVAVKARATNNLNDQSSRMVYVIATRKLRIWDAEEEEMTADPQTTRSPVWAMVDAFTAEYGGNRPDSVFDMEALVALDLILAEREEYFDWIFDQKVACWDVAQVIMQTVRAVPMIEGSKITAIRDGTKSFPTAIFNQENIVRGSFQWEIKLIGNDEKDGLLVSYIDGETFKEETVLCCMPDEEGDDPDTMRLIGVTQRDHAYRTGMYLRRVKRMLRENYSFGSGMEAHIPSYGDMVAVAHDIPRWESGGMLTGIVKTPSGGDFTYRFNLGEPAVFGVGDHSILIRKNDGSEPAGPYEVTAVGGTDKAVITAAMAADADLDAIVFDNQREPPLYLFGPNDAIGAQVRITGLAPGSDDTVKVSAVPYTEDLFTEEDGTAPAQGNTHGNIPGTPVTALVSGLRVSRSPGTVDEVVASWLALRGAERYILQTSVDGITWETLSSEITGLEYRFKVNPGYLYVRIKGVLVTGGGWAYWTGPAPVETTSVVVDNENTPAGVTSVATQGGFGSGWVGWTPSTNSNLKGTHIYISSTTTQPGAPTYFVPVGQNFYGIAPLPDNATRYLWLEEESVGGRLSTASGPHSFTTVNGITLDHLIPGGLRPVEIVSVIPSTGNYVGRLVYLTTADAVGSDYLTGNAFQIKKIYRWDGAGTYASPVSGKGSWTNATTTDDIVAGAITAGLIAAGAITATAVGTNEIIAHAANIADAIITSAKIIDLAANKIAAGDMTAVNIGHSGRLFHVSYPSRKFNSIEHAAGFNASHNYGAGTGFTFTHDTGVRVDGPGNGGSNPTLQIKSGAAEILYFATIGSYTGGATLYYRINGGGSYMALAAVNSDNGGNAVWSGTRQITGLSETDYLEFFIAPCNGSGDLISAGPYRWELDILCVNW